MYNIDYNILVHHIPTNIDICKTLKEVENPNLILNEYSDKNQGINIYTDASKIAGAKSVGCACICKEIGNLNTRKPSYNCLNFYSRMFCIKRSPQYHYK